MSAWFEEESFAEQLGALVSQWRMVQGLSQTVVAERAGISTKVLGRIERGEGAPGTPALLAVLDVLGLRTTLLTALDPLSTDVGRARAHLLTRRRAPRAARPGGTP